LTYHNEAQDSPLWAKFRQLTFVQQVAVGLLFFLIPLIVVAFYRPSGIFWGNQHLYYLSGMYEAGVEYLQNDTEAQMQPIHFLFNKLVYVLQKMGWLASGSQILSALLLAVFGFGCILISIGTVMGWRKRQRRPAKFQDLVLALTIAALFVVLMNRTTFTDIYGMAATSLLTQYFQASQFAAFVVLGIGFMTLGHWRAATISFIITSIFHSNYLVLCGPLMLIILYETYRQGKFREGFLLCVLYGLVNLPLFIIGPLQWTQVNTPDAIYNYNMVRSPHHFDVRYWWNETELMRVLIMGLATILALWKLSSTVARIMWVYFTVIVLSVAIVWFTDSYTVASLVPWRASNFLLPMSQLIILATVIIIIFELTPQKTHTPMLLIMTVIASIYWISMKPWDWFDAYYNYTSPEISMVRQHTETHDVILIPPRMDEAFRVYAERPTFVTWKAMGYDIDDWFNRIAVAEEMMTATSERQHELCAEYAFAYYLLPVDAPAVNDVTPIASTDEYLLVACPT
jgi:hypothetical protein